MWKINFKRLLFFVLPAFIAVIKVQCQVSAGFAVTPPSVNCNPAVYSFTNTSSGVAPLTYEWNFGVHPGVNSVFQNPSTTYINCGTYMVTLIVTNGNGQKDSTTQSLTIRCSPTASFASSSLAGCVPFAATFTSTSTAGSGSITNYLWDFGDGYNGNGASPAHIYNEPGCKNITLIVTNSFGCTNNTTLNNILCAYPRPVADFAYNSPGGLCVAPASVSYQNLSDSGNAPYTYKWSFQGGTPAVSTNANPTVTYNALGSFSTTLITTDVNGCIDTAARQGYITVASNTADFTLSKMNGCISDTIIVSGIASAVPKSWKWSVSPAATISNSVSQNSLFTFGNAGTYTICLDIDYGGGCTAQKCSTVVINPSPIAKLGFSGLLNTCLKPDVITFTDSASDPNLTYKWLFPGGSPANATGPVPPPVTYNRCGSYSASLTATDTLGCMASYSAQNFLTITCPRAVFKLSPPFGCLPLNVTFNSAPSSGNPVSWLWDFGDTLSGANNSSTLQNPSHLYNYPGCYSVILTTTTAEGCVNSDTMPAAVCAGHKPHANFSANPPVNCANMPVYFTDSSTGTFAYTTYIWDFHGGPPFYNESAIQNPSYIYDDTGYIKISLIVSNYGCADTLTKDDLIYLKGPVAIAHATTSCKGLSVFLDGSASVDAQRYSWVLPGAIPDTSSAPTVSVTYPTTGIYTANLICYNDTNGCQYLQQISYPIGGVQANFAVSNQNNCSPLRACTQNTSVGAATYTWMITDSFGNAVDTSHVPSPCFTLSAGTYSVLLIATDSLGCSDSLYQPNILHSYKPVVNFSALPVGGCAPLNVNFTDSSSLYASNILKWRWNFGDNSSPANTSSLTNPVHTYNNTGSYTVSLTITDKHGCINSTNKINYINASQMSADFSSQTISGCGGTQVCLTGDSVPPGSAYSWNFGDDSTSTTASPCHTYTSSGNFKVTLVVSDPVGCRDTISKITPVIVSRPHSGFIADTTGSTCPPLQVSFTNLSTAVSSASSYSWFFGDGQVSSAIIPVHIYNVAGIFDVTLVVTNQNGCRDTFTIKNYIHIGGPSAFVVSSPTSGCVPHSACIKVYSNSTISYTWNFGDGTVEVATDSVCYTYLRPGTFFPELILNDGAGCVYAMPVGLVSVSGAYTYFTVDTPFACKNGIFNFADSTFGVSPVQSLLWNFDDPNSAGQNTSVLNNPSHFYTSSGTYHVLLTTSTSDGCIDSFSRPVIVGTSPAVNFATVNSNNCSSQQILFYDNTSSGSPVKTRSWDFGDPSSGAANTSILPQPVHTYTAPGTYNVKLIEITDNGCNDSISLPVTVYQSPVASFHGTDTCLNTQPIVFVNTSQFANYYQWYFGDGSSSAQPNPVHTYVTSGTYKTTLIAQNSTCGDTLTSPVKVFPLPNASFTLPYNNSCASNVTIQVQNHSTGAIDYSWDFGNNTNSTLFNPAISYTSSGQYIISLQARNTFLCVDTVSATFSLYQQPVASFITHDTCLNTQPLFFNQNSQFATIYNWNFGDGASSILPNPTHTYATAGVYTATLIADNNYCADTAAATVNIFPVPGASFVLPFNYMCGPPANLSPENTSTGASAYNWNFGNGITSSNTNPAIAYTSPGTYIISLVAQNGNFCFDTVSKSFVVYPYPVIQNIDITSADGCGPLTVSVKANATNGNQFTWNFGDQSTPITSGQPEASHTYNQAGTFTISLQVISYMTCGDTVTLNDTIKVYISPRAGFDDTLFTSGDPVNGTVIFTNTSQNADSYLWSFGDGTTSPEENPTHLYPQIDSFEATLIAETNHGCKDSISKWLHVIKKSLYVPNAFAPDFGTGSALVKEWKPAGMGLYSYHAQIFDKWGELLWESTSLTDDRAPAEGWDGTYQGKLCQQDVYVWKIEAVFMDGTRWEGMSYEGSPRKTIGSVTLIR